MLKKVGLSLLVIVVLFLAIALFLPSKWRVERAVTIGAQQTTILPLVADLHRWQEWSVWNEMDPECTWNISGPPMGPGATMEWKGPKMGVGKLTIVEMNPEHGLRYEMSMDHGVPAKGVFTMTAEGTGTKVTWVDEGDMGWFLPGRYFVGAMEEALGDHFEKSLARLKPLAEIEQKKADEKAAAKAAAAPEAPAATAEAK